MNPERASSSGTPRQVTAREAGIDEDLRHLADVTELVGEVADLHHATERPGASHPVLEVADDRLARDQELVDEGHPRPTRQPPCLD